jgi:hypothetical protein
MITTKERMGETKKQRVRGVILLISSSGRKVKAKDGDGRWADGVWAPLSYPHALPSIRTIADL